MAWFITRLLGKVLPDLLILADQVEDSDPGGGLHLSVLDLLSDVGLLYMAQGHFGLDVGRRLLLSQFQRLFDLLLELLVLLEQLLLSVVGLVEMFFLLS